MDWMSWQIDYLLILQNFREITQHCFDGFFLFITTFGEAFFPILFICFIYWCINKKTGIFIFLNISYGVMLNTIFKMSACIYRPWILSSKIHPVPQAISSAWGYSFPSGHSSMAMAYWGSAAMKFWKNVFLRILFILIIFLIMFSRNYLGVHTPQDVIFAFAYMLVVLYFSNKILIWEEKKKNRDIIIVGIITIALKLILLYMFFKSYPVDYLNGKILYDPTSTKFNVLALYGTIYGFIYGWLVEKRLVKFTTKNVNLFKKSLRYILGMLILLLCIIFLKPICLSFNKCAGGFCFNLFQGLYITAIFPYLIKKLRI